MAKRPPPPNRKVKTTVDLDKFKAHLDAGRSFAWLDAHYKKSHGWARDISQRRGWQSQAKAGRQGNGPPWSVAEKKELLKLRDLGLSFGEISLKLHEVSGQWREEKAICRKYHRMVDPKYVKQKEGYRRPGYDPENEAPRVERRCIGPNCRGTRLFLSKGPWNRLCHSCTMSMAHLHDGYV